MEPLRNVAAAALVAGQRQGRSFAFLNDVDRWPKEVGNVPYVVDNGAGVFSNSSKQTASLVARWFGPESEELKKMSQNALKLAQPDAVFDIVRDIHELAERQGRL